jgi:transposase
MRPKGTAAELERRRRLAVRRVEEGYRPVEVARFLGVHIRTVHRWLAAVRDAGPAALVAKRQAGPKHRLSIEQEVQVLSWLLYPATSFGFFTELWTAPRAAVQIEKEFGVRYHPRYVNAWLRERGVTPQKPRLQPRERDQAALDRWVAQEWERLKKKRTTSRPTSS